LSRFNPIFLGASVTEPIITTFASVLHYGICRLLCRRPIHTASKICHSHPEKTKPK